MTQITTSSVQRLYIAPSSRIAGEPVVPPLNITHSAICWLQRWQMVRAGYFFRRRATIAMHYFVAVEHWGQN